PYRPRVEHRVVRDDVLDFGGGAADLARHETHRRARHVSLLLLRQEQRVQDCGLPPLPRIVGHDLVEPRLVLGRVLERAPGLCQRSFRLVEPGRRVLHLGMKAHRSTSPMTTSEDPMMAMTSAIMPPMISFGSAWHARSEGGRILIRHGRFVPSEMPQTPCSPRGPSTGTYACPSGTVKPCEEIRQCWMSASIPV